MKGLFSTATLLAVLAALTAAAPITERAVVASVPAEFFIVTDEAHPQTFSGASQTAVISRTNGSGEKASYVSFDMTSVPGATASSTCTFVIKNPAAASGSQNTQLFTLGGPISSTSKLSFWQHPFHDQYAGVYKAQVGASSTAIDVATVPCNFGRKSQYVMRPQNDNDYITWTQGAGVGAFIEVRN